VRKMSKIVVEKRIIKEVFESLAIQNNEVLLNFMEDKLHAGLSNLNISSFMILNVGKDVFEQYSPLGKIGVDVEKLCNIIKRFNKFVSISKGDVLTLSEGNLEVEVPIIDESTIEKEKKFDINWNTFEKITISKEVLNSFKEDSKAIIVGKENSDISYVRLTKKDDNLAFVSSLDEFKLLRKTDIKLSKEFKLDLSPSLLNKHIGIIKTDEVEMWIKTEQPLRMKYGFYEVLLAPRVNCE